MAWCSLTARREIFFKFLPGCLGFQESGSKSCLFFKFLHTHQFSIKLAPNILQYAHTPFHYTSLFSIKLFLMNLQDIRLHKSSTQACACNKSNTHAHNNIIGQYERMPFFRQRLRWLITILVTQRVYHNSGTNFWETVVCFKKNMFCNFIANVET